METVIKAFSITYRRFLTHFVPGLILLLVLVIVFPQPLNGLRNSVSLDTWAYVFLAVVMSLGIGVVLSSLSYILFEPLCLETGALDWVESFPGATVKKVHIDKESERLMVCLSKSKSYVNRHRHSGYTNDNAEDRGIFLSLVRMALQTSKATTEAFEFAEMYSGMAIFMRDLALIAMLSCIILILPKHGERAAILSLLILILPLARYVYLPVSKNGDNSHERTSVTIRQSAVIRLIIWPVFWVVWLSVFTIAALPLGALAFLAPIFSLIMLGCFRLMCWAAAMERLTIVQNPDTFKLLAKSWKNRELGDQRTKRTD
jgi:hypothetical protein